MIGMCDVDSIREVGVAHGVQALSRVVRESPRTSQWLCTQLIEKVRGRIESQENCHSLMDMRRKRSLSA